MLSRATLVKSVSLQVLLPEKFNCSNKRTNREFTFRKKKQFVHKGLTSQQRIGRILASLERTRSSSQDENDQEPSERVSGAVDRPQRDSYGNFVTAIGLIMGTAVGPGILGLPAATVPAGLQASSVIVLAAWAYVTATILLVAELSCAVMAEKGLEEVSFTGLVLHTLGYSGACAVAVVYASLNYALLVACIAGLGSIVQAWLLLPLPVPLLSAISATLVGVMVAFAPFKVVDGVNKGLCGLMISAITGLLGLGIYAGRELWGAQQYPGNG